jgi:hypothetical protein
MLVDLPVLLLSVLIAAGILFELGQSSKLSSSEAVNWLPISPREYVIGSALSMITVYSPLLMIGIGITLPVALQFGLMYLWPVSVILSLIALFKGAFILEILKAVMNRVSQSVYRRSGKVGVISRLLLLITLFVVIQLSFNPYILLHILGVIVHGIKMIWFIPIIWPSAALINLSELEIVSAIVFSVSSIAFTVCIFEIASALRLKYWSPAPVSIVLKPSPKYIPQTPVIPGLLFNSLEIAIALKDFKSLIRRKEMARFLAIPVIITISFILPTLITPSSHQSENFPGSLMAGFIPFMIPLMLSMISIGQEGKGIFNISMVPISEKELIKGKLLPPWIISLLATLGIVGVFEIIQPMGTITLIVMILTSMLVSVVESLIGLGVGSRYPDYHIGPRSRYVTFKGFFIGIFIGGIVALAIFTPVMLYLISSLDSVLLPVPNLTVMFVTSILIGLVLTYFSYRYCKQGMKLLISNLELN